MIPVPPLPAESTMRQPAGGREGDVVDEARAWASLMTNLLVLPGLGSLLAGRRAGWPQAAVALVGFVLSTIWLAWFVVAWWRTGSFPLDGGPYLPMGLLGVFLFAVSWVWGLVTGLALGRESRAPRASRRRTIDSLPPGA
ncbi:MAG TPA: hypothetical protein VJ144_05045 [Candidatus Polarisedimenticolia bacterium]|nr:hypothetical protein [Candidatus Polarisedimenticolia bacterium]